VYHLTQLRPSPVPWVLITLVTVGVSVSIAAAPSAALPPESVDIEGRAHALGEGLGQLTGLAVSPLWALTVFGIIDWFSAAPEQLLPLHASPWVWGLALLTASLALVAQLGTGILPMPLRKVVGAAAYLEQHVSGLIVAGVFLPTLVSTIEAAGLGHPMQIEQEPVIQANILGGLLAGTLTTLIYAIVRIVSLTIDALILLSPFFAVDAVLFAIRTVVVGIIFLTLAIHPLLSLLLCSAVIIGCALVVGWCMRLNLFASSCMWDILTLRWRRTRPQSGSIRAFMASGVYGPAIRTRGVLEPAFGQVRFRWRPWFILPARCIEVPLSSSVVVRGIVWSSISNKSGDHRQEFLLLPPRYLSHEETVAGRLGGDVEDGLIRRSIRQTIDFVRGVGCLADTI